MYTVGIITSSDKEYSGEREDKSGAVIREIIKNASFKIEKMVIVPDEEEMLKEGFINMSDELKVNLILSTGGAGFSKRDITPEATKKIIDRETPGICGAIRMCSLQIAEKAIPSRAVSGVRKNALIVNLPGSPKACEEASDLILDELEHGIGILIGEAKECARK